MASGTEEKGRARYLVPVLTYIHPEDRRREPAATYYAIRFKGKYERSDPDFDVEQFLFSTTEDADAALSLAVRGKRKAKDLAEYIPIPFTADELCTLEDGCAVAAPLLLGPRVLTAGVWERPATTKTAQA